MEISDYVEVPTYFKLATILENLNVPYVVGKVWTTDGFYRETRANFEKRKMDGCICVDMECASLAAISAFRNIEFYEFMYSADNLDSTTWDKRILGNLTMNEREKYMYLALEIAINI
jgi:purine-nucleoside phosphorylase